MKLTERLFDMAFTRWMRSRVRMHVTGLPEDIPSDVPLLYCTNHVSWWDGFLVRELHRLLHPGAPFKAVMLEDELRKRPLLRMMGGMGIDPASLASGRRLLDTLLEARPGVGVTLLTQGAVRPEADPLPGFRCGLTNLARVLAPSLLLPVGIRMLPGTTHRMEALVTVGEPRTVTEAEPLDGSDVEVAVAAHPSIVRGFLPRRTPAVLPLAPYILSPSRN